MTVLMYTSLFDNIDRYVDTHVGGQGARTGRPIEARTLGRARELVHGPLRHEAEAQRVWGDLMSEAATDPTFDGLPALLLVWFAAPRLRSVVRRASSRLPVERLDLEAESVLGLLENVKTVDPRVAGAGEALMRAAASRTWRFARRALPQSTVRDPSLLPQPSSLPSPGAAAAPWALSITPPGRNGGIAASIRFSMSKEQIEGERLGAMAVGMGLSDVVRRARRPSPGRRIGTLTLHPGGVRNEW
ncbi:hypothetical protein ACF07U_18205 [Streptomyces californicus]|uniref:hypothetical protein n=1 Tax=Streptomyces californicus TaxID=67351 RepID=UPI003701A812